MLTFRRMKSDPLVEASNGRDKDFDGPSSNNSFFSPRGDDGVPGISVSLSTGGFGA